MDRPATRLFHLHFNTPDVPGAERRLADFGLPLYRRFGHVAGEFRAFDPGEEVPGDFRLRLQNAQRGYVNVTLAPGTRPRFDHLGLCTDSFDAVCDRAEDAGWSVRDRDGRRTFLTTPWGFRVEVHPDGSDVEADLGSWATAHFERVDLAVTDADAVRREFEAVFGDVPGLRFRDDEAEHASVPTFVIAGDASPEQAADVDALLVG